MNTSPTRVAHLEREAKRLNRNDPGSIPWSPDETGPSGPTPGYKPGPAALSGRQRRLASSGGTCEKLPRDRLNKESPTRVLGFLHWMCIDKHGLQDLLPIFQKMEEALNAP